MVYTCGVVVLAASGVGEGIVGVVYELEFTGAFLSFGGAFWNAVGVSFECCSGVLLAVAYR